ncbi:MAG TPA: hypothetical protein VM186_12780, partial [Planctomycetota bacterium]|nr:hypothetical protein [Planctomycetota bacterium]
ESVQRGGLRLVGGALAVIFIRGNHESLKPGLSEKHLLPLSTRRVYSRGTVLLDSRVDFGHHHRVHVARGRGA